MSTRRSTACSKVKAVSGPDTEVELQVTGRGGVPDTATAVTINVGAVRASQPGYVTVYPCGEERPLASSINYRGNDVISNSVVAQIGEDGKVCIYTLRETDLIADVTGYVEDDGVVTLRRSVCVPAVQQHDVRPADDRVADPSTC